MRLSFLEHNLELEQCLPHGISNRGRGIYPAGVLLLILLKQIAKRWEIMGAVIGWDDWTRRQSRLVAPPSAKTGGRFSLSGRS